MPLLLLLLLWLGLMGMGCNAQVCPARCTNGCAPGTVDCCPSRCTSGCDALGNSNVACSGIPSEPTAPASHCQPRYYAPACDLSCFSFGSMCAQETCEVNGNCLGAEKNVGAMQASHCQPRYFGPRCSDSCFAFGRKCAKQDCAANGSCLGYDQYNGTVAALHCEGGYFGPACADSCMSFGGMCRRTLCSADGNCIDYQLYSGSQTADHCKDGFYGPRCTESYFCGSGPVGDSSCLLQKCAADGGCATYKRFEEIGVPWMVAGHCRKGYYGRGCKERCSAYRCVHGECSIDGNCARYGVVDEPDVAFHCVTGLFGPSCAGNCTSRIANCAVRNYCSVEGHCVRNWPNSCLHCVGLFHGPDCSVPHANTFADLSRYCSADSPLYAVAANAIAAAAQVPSVLCGTCKRFVGDVFDDVHATLSSILGRFRWVEEAVQLAQVLAGVSRSPSFCNGLGVIIQGACTARYAALPTAVTIPGAVVFGGTLVACGLADTNAVGLCKLLLNDVGPQPVAMSQSFAEKFADGACFGCREDRRRSAQASPLDPSIVGANLPWPSTFVSYVTTMSGNVTTGHGFVASSTELGLAVSVAMDENNTLGAVEWQQCDGGFQTGFTVAGLDASSGATCVRGPTQPLCARGPPHAILAQALFDAVRNVAVWRNISNMAAMPDDGAIRAQDFVRDELANSKLRLGDLLFEQVETWGAVVDVRNGSRVDIRVLINGTRPLAITIDLDAERVAAVVFWIVNDTITTSELRRELQVPNCCTGLASSDHSCTMSVAPILLRHLTPTLSLATVFDELKNRVFNYTFAASNMTFEASTVETTAPASSGPSLDPSATQGTTLSTVVVVNASVQRHSLASIVLAIAMLQMLAWAP